MQKAKRKVIVGLDISTSTTGITVIDKETGRLVTMQHTTMTAQKKFPDFWSKVIHMKEYIEDLHEELEEDYIVERVAVEESMKRFTPGFSSAGTLFTLAKFNGILSFICMQEFGLKSVEEINVRSARSKLGIKIDHKDKSKSTKQKVLEIVVAKKPDFPWVIRDVKGEMKMTKVNEDRADSWIIAEACRSMHS